MIINGQLFKQTRKEKKISQIDLSKGICSQATISNIENKSTCDSISILIELCNRLDLNYETILINQKGNKTNEFMAHLEKLFFMDEDKEMIDYLDKNKDLLKKVTNQNDKALINYYYAKGLACGRNKPLEALFYLQKNFIQEADQDDLVWAYTTSGLGLCYHLLDRKEEAEYNFNESIRFVNKANDATIEFQVKLLSSASKFYSEIGQNKKAIEIANEAITELRSAKKTEFLDTLNFQLASDYSKINKAKQATKSVVQAIVFAELNENKKLIDKLKKAIKNNELTVEGIDVSVLFG